MGKGPRNTPEELILCSYAAMYDAEDFGGVDAIHALGFRSLASIKMKIQNIAAMLDEEGIDRASLIKSLTGLPYGKTGRRTDWEFVSKYVNLSRDQHLLECQDTTNRIHPLPGEIPPYETFREGSVRRVVMNVYERDSRARRRCIQHHGSSCVICGFSFGKKYGVVANDFIHVHHLRPLSEIAEEYELDPIEDLRPVCPNCHAIIHLGNANRSIDEMKQLLNRSEK